MKNIVLLVILMLWSLPLQSSPGDIYCDVAEIDNLEGVPLLSASRVIAGSDGYLWVATWNGLLRYDGQRAAKIPMKMRPGDRPTSERFHSLNTSGNGNLWAVIDERLLHFNTDTYIYSDIHADLEKRLNTKFKVKRTVTTDDRRLLLETEDGRWITIGENEQASSATISPTKPDYHRARPLKPYVKAVIDATGIDDFIYSASSGGVDVVITRDGRIIAGHTGLNDYSEVCTLAVAGKSLAFQDTDVDNNIWLRSAGRLFKVNISLSEHIPLPVARADKVRATMVDSQRRVWLAESDGNAIGIYSNEGKLIGYLAADGSLSTVYRPFGHKVYALAEYPRGTLWIGTKPDGLFRYTLSGDGSLIPSGHTDTPISVYDIAPDRYGRLWIASIDNGVSCIAKPTSSPLTATVLSSSSKYPKNALRARTIHVTPDSLFVATTSGLLVAPLPDRIERFKPTLHTATGADGSLSGVAISDAVVVNGSVVTATETAGINIGLGNPLVFSKFSSPTGGLPDPFLSLVKSPADSLVTAVSNNTVYTFNPTSPQSQLLKTAIEREKISFTEPRPIYLSDSTLLLAHSRGALILNLKAGRVKRHLPLRFTSVSIQNRPDSLLSASTDTLVMSVNERNLTLRFATLEFNRPGEIDYSFKIDDNEWTSIDNTNSITFLDLEPGTHTVSIRSTTPDGLSANNETTMTIIVTPRFSETPLAKALLALLIAACLGAGIYLWLYIRGIKRSRRETLEAYLRLVEERAAGEPVATEPIVVKPTKVSAADQDLMDKIVKFVDANLSNSEVSVDDLSAAIGVSRSSLSRKMRSLVGVTPADFIKQSRLKRAATLLETTDDAVKNIAFDCGFSDINYFSKCFKAAYNVTPTAYRRRAD